MLVLMSLPTFLIISLGEFLRRRRITILRLLSHVDKFSRHQFFSGARPCTLTYFCLPHCCFPDVSWTGILSLLWVPISQGKDVTSYSMICTPCPQCCHLPTPWYTHSHTDTHLCSICGDSTHVMYKGYWVSGWANKPHIFKTPRRPDPDTHGQSLRLEWRDLHEPGGEET